MGRYIMAALAAACFSSGLGHADVQTNADWGYHHMSYLIDRSLNVSATKPLANGSNIGFSAEHHNGLSGGFFYLGTKAGPMGHLKLSDKWSSDLAAGAHNLQNHYENDTNLHLTYFYANVMVNYQARVDTKFQLRYGQDIIYKDWYDPMHAKLRLTENVVEGYFDYNPFDLRTHGQLRRAWLSDGNVRDGYEGYVLYVLLPKPLEFRAGFGVWEVAYKLPRWYWTPDEMVDVNARMEIEFTPVPGWWGNAKFYLGRSEERRGHPQQSSYQELRVNRDLKIVNLGLYYCRWNSIGPDNVWWREDTGLTLSRTF